MKEITQRRRHRSRDELDELQGESVVHPKFSYATWVAVAVGGSAVLGAGVSLYGANKQSKDNAHAQDVNAQLQRDQNDAAWANWLMTRGIAPTSRVSAGTIPSAGGYNVVNTRMPLWASINMPTGAARWQKATRTGYSRPNTLAVTPSIGAPTAAPSATTGSASN